MTTGYNQRILPDTDYGSRTDIIFLVTQALDFLMTEDNDYLITEDSYSLNTDYTIRLIV